MRVPLTHGLPIMTAGSVEIRACVMNVPLRPRGHNQTRMIAGNAIRDKPLRPPSTPFRHAMCFLSYHPPATQLSKLVVAQAERAENVAIVLAQLRRRRADVAGRSGEARH